MRVPWHPGAGEQTEPAWAEGLAPTERDSPPQMIHWTLPLVFNLGRKEVSDLLLAQVLHRGSALAGFGHTGDLADVSDFSLMFGLGGHSW